MLFGHQGEGRRATEARVRSGRELVTLEPLDELPSDRRVEVGPGRDEPVVQHGAPHVPGRLRPPRGVDGVTEQHPELLGGALLAEGPGGLVGSGAVDGVSGDVDRRLTVDDPVGHDRSHARRPRRIPSELSPAATK